MRKKIRFLISITMIMTLMTGCSMLNLNFSGHSDTTVHIAIQPSAAFVPMFVAREEGWIEEALEEYGVSVVWDSFESGPPMNEALLAEDADIGVIGDVPTVTVCAPGNGVEVIAIAAQAARSYAILVPTNSDIDEASDLKGKRVAATFGSTAHNLVEKFLMTAGLTIEDVELVNIAAGDAATVLSKNQADAVAIWEPTVTRLTDSGTAKIIGEGIDCGLAGTNAVVSRTDFAANNTEIVTEILTQYKRAADALLEPDSLKDGTLKNVAAYLSVEEEQLKSILQKFAYTVEISQEDIFALNDTIDFLNRNGIMKISYDINESTDGSYYKRR